MDRIEPIRPRPPQTEPIPAVRRVVRSSEERPRRDEHEDAERRPPRKPHREPPPDDGRPHIDVTV